MKQQKFETLYRREWEEFGLFLDAKERTAKRFDKFSNLSVRDFPEQYRKMCHYLSIAKERKYSFFLIEQLNRLVLRGHQHLYTSQKGRFRTIIRFFILDFPALIRKEWRIVSLALILFYFSGLLMATLTYLYPELIHSIFNQEQINQFETMYDPAEDHIGNPRGSDTDLYMFGYYIAHNIGISFQTFAGGILFGLGSMFYLIYNGIVMGAVMTHLEMAGYGATFFPFVIGHSSFELTAIAFAGAAGLKLGFSIIAPGRQTRIESVKLAARVCVRIIFGVIAMLLIAAFLEAFWSSNAFETNIYKYIVGTCLWLLIFVYFVFSGRNHGA